MAEVTSLRRFTCVRRLQVIAPVPSGCSGVVVEYRTRSREVAGSIHTPSSASKLEQVANLRCAEVNSASYPQRDELFFNE